MQGDPTRAKAIQRGIAGEFRDAAGDYLVTGTFNASLNRLK